MAYVRTSQAYQDLLDRAYDALYQNEGFKTALAATGNAELKHSVGKHKQGETCLTTQEFCHRLNKLRERLKRETEEALGIKKFKL